MVSAQYYLKAFFNSMKERNRILGRKLKKKTRMDVRMLTGKIKKNDVSVLLNLIGEDDKRRVEPRKKGVMGHLFGPKVHLEDQSIRFMMSQTIKSGTFFEERQQQLMKKAKSEQIPGKIWKQFTTYMEWIAQRMPNAKDYALQLNELYEKEAKALAENDTTTYLKHVVDEQKLMESYSGVSEDFATQTQSQAADIAAGVFGVLEDMEPQAAVLLLVWYVGLAAFGFYIVPAVAISKNPEWAPAIAMGVLAIGGTLSAFFVSDVVSEIKRQQKALWGS